MQKHRCKYPKINKNYGIIFLKYILNHFKVWKKFHKKKNKKTGLHYDVALVTLKKKFDLKHVTPICLVSKQLDKVPQNPFEISGKYI